MQPTDPTDEDLARLAVAGDRNAAGELVQKYKKLLAGFLRRVMLVREQDIDDILGDVWIRVLQALPRRKPGNFPAWLRTIARNRVLDLARSPQRNNANSELIELVPSPPLENHEADPDLIHCLQELGKVNARFHRIVIAFYYDATPDNEVAEQENIEVTSVRTARHKAIHALKQCVERRTK